LVVFLSLPLWKKKPLNTDTAHDLQLNAANPPPSAVHENESPANHLPASIFRHPEKNSILKTKNLIYILIAFFCYSAFEAITLLWASSYLVGARGISRESAAMYASFAYIGMTAGRFISGIFSNKLGNRNIIRIGLSTAIVGILALFLAFNQNFIALMGLIIVGLGAAPIFPAIIHSTSYNFGKQNSQAIVGVQLAFAYTGSTLMNFVFGLVADHISIKLYPVFLLLFVAIAFTMIEILNRKVKSEKEKVISIENSITEG